MGGMMTSATRLFTILPNAPPMTTPTAMSMTFPLIANSLNSFSMGYSFPFRQRTPRARPRISCADREAFGFRSPGNLASRREARDRTRRDGEGA